MAAEFILLTEDTFHASYLVARWQEEFGAEPGGNGIALRAARPAGQLLRDRRELHARLRGRHALDAAAWRQLERLYPDLDEADRAMVAAFGAPSSPARYDQADFLGDDLNGPSAQEWLAKQCASRDELFIFIFLDQILEPWWIEATRSHIINAHSAVLPNARGMHAIEQVAAAGDLEFFRRTAGATAHYVDRGVDTGPIILAERFTDPFSFESIWDCKAHSFNLAFDILVRLARQLISGAGTAPVGTRQDPELAGPEFKRANFTPERRRQAESGYREMRNRVHGG